MRNLIVVKALLPSAGFIASFKRWKELGRYVKKGETSTEGQEDTEDHKMLQDLGFEVETVDEMKKSLAVEK